MIHRRRAKPLLGTMVEIGVIATSAEQADDAINFAFAEVATIHRLMSFHQGDSDLSRINTAAPGEDIEVDVRTAQVLHAAQIAAEESAYAFDCTVGTELVAAGLLPGDPVCEATAADATAAHAGKRWHIDNQTVRKHTPCLLDLGGIAKGYAVDRALGLLLQYGCEEILINAGGDLRYHGSEPMVVHLRSPAKPDSMPLAVSLYNEALASSAAGGLNADGIGERSALFDGVSRRALQPGSAVSIVARNCIDADLLTKVVLASGDPLHPMLAARGAQVAFYGKP